MRNAMERLTTVLDDNIAEPPCVYHRCGTAIPCVAVIGNSEHRLTDSDGIFTTFRTVDFLIAREQLAGIGLPERGDYIMSSHDGEMRRYDLVSDGENVFRRSDEYGIRYRIHTSPSS